jgi:hypothetical protein
MTSPSREESRVHSDLHALILCLVSQCQVDPYLLRGDAHKSRSSRGIQSISSRGQVGGRETNTTAGSLRRVDVRDGDGELPMESYRSTRESRTVREALRGSNSTAASGSMESEIRIIESMNVESNGNWDETRLPLGGGGPEGRVVARGSSRWRRMPVGRW